MNGDVNRIRNVVAESWTTERLLENMLSLRDSRFTLFRLGFLGMPLRRSINSRLAATFAVLAPRDYVMHAKVTNAVDWFGSNP